MEIGSLYGFIDTNGNMVIKPKFIIAISPFKNGVTMVGLGVSVSKAIAGYIDKKGNIIKQWPYDPNDLLKGSHPPMNPNATPQTNILVKSSLPALAVGENTGIRSPKIIKRVSPEYPKEAVENRIQGLVIVNLVIDIYGRVVEASAFEGPVPLKAAAEKAIKQWIFEPTIVDGIPRRVKMTTMLNFKLNP